ncbi:MAG: carboxylating nicotinate-nucleotide diphosphorylase [Actinomycetes bacterium]
MSREAPRTVVVDAVRRALAEDLEPLGDLTASLLDADATGVLVIASRQVGVIAGQACVREAFAQVDSTIVVEVAAPDGTAVGPGDVVATVRGSMVSILSAERTALNFLGHLSGVATQTRLLVDAVSAVSPTTRVLDTRKTTPGLRALEKAAVRAGGGTNHRASLSDAVLLKDNHLGAIGISIGVARAKVMWPGRNVEVECDTLEQVAEAAEARATSVLLDNMTPDEAAVAAALARSIHPGILVEVSGNISLATAPLYAACGVDLISVGALTHSAPVLDLGLDLVIDKAGGDTGSEEP